MGATVRSHPGRLRSRDSLTKHVDMQSQDVHLTRCHLIHRQMIPHLHFFILPQKWHLNDMQETETVLYPAVL
jgi:hypothetical protein